MASIGASRASKSQRESLAFQPGRTSNNLLNDNRGRPDLSRRKSLANQVQEESAEFSRGALYEYAEEEEQPLQPWPTVNVRTFAGGRPMPTGPLAWIESDRFQLFVGAVVVGNVLLMVEELCHPGFAQSLWYIDEFILIFYIFEMTLRLSHFGSRFFWDRWADAAWNWLDMLIITAGIVDQWVITPSRRGQAHLGEVGEQVHSDVDSPSLVVKLCRVLRVLRLLRIVRLLHAVLRSDFRWTESPWFQSLVGAIIALNALIMGLETDIESPIWWWVEQCMLAFFVFEIIVRVQVARLKFIYDPDNRAWNVLDLVIVLTGVVDQWMIPLWSLFILGRVQRNSIGQMMMLVRMLRLMRILRLLRLVKTVRPLYHLAVGIMRALQSMFWVLVLTMVALYAFAILATRVLGQKGIVTVDIPSSVTELFSTVPNSLFTLFGLMNGQYWHQVYPIFDVLPWTKPVWVVFTIFSSWSLLSVMTGVVSDNMLEVRQQQERKDNEQIEDRRANLRRVLTEIFTAADKDGSGALEKQEYTDLLFSPFHIRKLQRIANVPVKDLLNMFDWIDVDGSGEIDFEEFMHGFDWLNEPIMGKSLLKIESAVKQRCAVLQKNVAILRNEMLRMRITHEKQVQQAQQMLETLEEHYKKATKIKIIEAEAFEAQAREARSVYMHSIARRIDPDEVPDPESPKSPGTPGGSGKASHAKKQQRSAASGSSSRGLSPKPNKDIGNSGTTLSASTGAVDCGTTVASVASGSGKLKTIIPSFRTTSCTTTKDKEEPAPEKALAQPPDACRGDGDGHEPKTEVVVTGKKRGAIFNIRNPFSKAS